jgi:hypothetical protein
LPYVWKPYPVIFLDFSFISPNLLEKENMNLCFTELILSQFPQGLQKPEKISGNGHLIDILILHLYNESRRQVVILMDEDIFIQTDWDKIMT